MLQNIELSDNMFLSSRQCGNKSNG